MRRIILLLMIAALVIFSTGFNALAAEDTAGGENPPSESTNGEDGTNTDAGDENVAGGENSPSDGTTDNAPGENGQNPPSDGVTGNTPGEGGTQNGENPPSEPTNGEGGTNTDAGDENVAGGENSPSGGENSPSGGTTDNAPGENGQNPPSDGVTDNTPGESGTQNGENPPSESTNGEDGTNTDAGDENVAGGENSPSGGVPTSKVDWDGVKNTVSDVILEWIKPHLEEISVVITLIWFVVDSARKHKRLNRSMNVLNNNSITVAEHTATNMNTALEMMQNASGAVTSYDERIKVLLESYNNTLEDNARFREEYTEMKRYLKASTEANIEFSNELAELLALANIPNHKKEELGRRHVERIAELRKAEAAAEMPLEVNVPEVTEDAQES